MAQILHPLPPVCPGIHPSAVVDTTAVVDATAEIGPLVVIGPRVRIAARALVGPGCVLAEDVSLGDDVRLVARVTVGERVSIGARSVVHPGAVVGGEGFGNALDRGSWVRVPQIGSVRVGADVDIGCNTTIDRGAIDDTVIEDGVKLDNQIQIGHNCRVGAHSALAGCVGMAGSTVIGKRCQIAGDVGFSGHLTVCDDVVVTGRALITTSIGKPGVYSGHFPALPASEWRRAVAEFRRVGRLRARLRALERRLGLSIEGDDGVD
jgi:UDP-3-O-[3-hydroxymyristoyl] glucosamine N-acyltransferase